MAALACSLSPREAAREDSSRHRELTAAGSAPPRTPDARRGLCGDGRLPISCCTRKDRSSTSSCSDTSAGVERRASSPALKFTCDTAPAEEYSCRRCPTACRQALAVRGCCLQDILASSKVYSIPPGRALPNQATAVTFHMAEFYLTPCSHELFSCVCRHTAPLTHVGRAGVCQLEIGWGQPGSSPVQQASPATCMD